MVDVIKQPEGEDPPHDPVAQQLAGLASEARGEPPPLGEGVTELDAAAREGAAPPMTNAQCVLMAAQLMREALVTVAHLESPKDTLADAKIEPAAAALGAVFDKHGWNLQAMTGGYQVELAALMTAGPVAYAAYMGVQQELKARAAPAAAPATTPKPTPAPQTFHDNDPRRVSLG